MTLEQKQKEIKALEYILEPFGRLSDEMALYGEAWNIFLTDIQNRVIEGDFITAQDCAQNMISILEEWKLVVQNGLDKIKEKSDQQRLVVNN